MHFTLRAFYLWTLDGLWAAAVCAYIPVLAASSYPDGRMASGGWAISWLSTWILTLGVDLRMWPEIYS